MAYNHSVKTPVCNACNRAMQPVIEQPWQMMQHAKRNYCEADPFELFVE
jgi:hypothetical protein